MSQIFSSDFLFRIFPQIFWFYRVFLLADHSFSQIFSQIFPADKNYVEGEKSVGIMISAQNVTIFQKFNMICLNLTIFRPKLLNVTTLK